MKASVLIASHNEGGLLRKTIESCLAGSRQLDFEIVVSDDASTDGSVASVEHDFPQLRIVRSSVRQGASLAKARGAEAARGKILLFLDGHSKPEADALQRLVDTVERFEGQAIVMPRLAALDSQSWESNPAQIGSGYGIDLRSFDTEWIPQIRLRPNQKGGGLFYESPSLIGCAFAVDRGLYEKLWGFDKHMQSWGVEDLDFGLKSWLMGHPIIHDPEPIVGHRFRKSFDNYTVPYVHLVLNKLRMARKAFSHSVWSLWLENCQDECRSKIDEDLPEGVWARVWHLFEQHRQSVEQERSHLHSARVHDEFWFANRFGLSWPQLPLMRPSGTAKRSVGADLIPGGLVRTASPSPPHPSPSPPPQNPVLKIVSPAPGSTFAIDGNANMPHIQLKAQITGVHPDPSPTTEFNWTIKLSLDASGCPNGPRRTISHPDIVATSVGGTFVIPFTKVRGGQLSMSVQATAAGKHLTAQLSGLKIVGTNPLISSIQAALPYDTLRRIARLESGDRQFNGAAGGGTSPCPLFSGDNLGGAGVMQLTNPSPTDDQVWNWVPNVAAGVQIFNGKIAGARNYPGQVRASTGFKTLVTQYNQNRVAHGLPAVQVILPEFTTGNFNTNLLQLELDTIRGYNGYGGHDAFGLPLHEFRVAVDATGLLVVTIDATGTLGTATWERVPVSARPASFGDPNYVADVLAQSP